MIIKIGEKSFDTTDISSLYKESVLIEDASLVENSFYTTVVRALDLADKVGLYKLNSGNAYWDFLIQALIKILISDKSKKVRKYFTSVYIYILLSELWCVLEEHSQNLVSDEDVESLKEDLPLLFESLEKGKFSTPNLTNMSSVGADRKLFDYKDKYQAVLREHRERKLLRDEIYSVLNVERSKLKSMNDSFSKDLDHLNKEISRARSDVDKVKKGGSFLVGWAGIEGLIDSLRVEKSRAKLTRYTMMFIVFLSVLFIMYSLKPIWVDGLFGVMFQGQYSESLISIENKSTYYIIDAIKNIVVNVVLLSCSLYFYRVALYDERRIVDMMRELEFKSAITAFQQPNLDRVSDLGGNVVESIERYEEFLYDRWNSTHNDEKEKAVTPEEKKDYISIIKSIADR